VISARNVTVTYRRNNIVALRDVNIEVPSETVTCILGPNASGKTTLLKTIAQLLNYSGVVEINGRDAKSIIRELRRILSYSSTIEEQDLLGVTVLDVLVYSRYPVSRGFFTSEDDIKRVYEIAEKLGLKGLLSRRLSELSAGELQRVVLAAALVKDPRILLLDEPDSHLDVYSKIWLSNFLREISSQVTIVLSTHDPIFASITCDYFIVLSRGEVVFTGSRGELLKNTGILESVYNVSFTSISLGELHILLPLNQSIHRDKLVKLGEQSHRDISYNSSNTRGDH